MKEQILEVLRKHPKGMRLREIGGEVGVWHIKLVPEMYELENEGKVISFMHIDNANMDNYIIYQITQKGA